MSNVLERQPPKFDKRITYGPDPNHFAELRFPEGRGPFPVLLMIHGGFWQSIYDLKHTGLLCADLTSRRIVTCNLEYRRIGDPGGGWPGTFQDISLAAHEIPKLLALDSRADVRRIAVMGHSAGGHLALWMVSRNRISTDSPLHDVEKSPISKAVSLAGVSDLRTALRQELGHGIVARLLDGGPDKHPDRYDAASPIELLPNDASTILIHGAADDIVPISQSRKYAQRAMQLAQQCTLVELDSVGHFELIDPESRVWPQVVKEIVAALDVRQLRKPRSV